MDPDAVKRHVADTAVSAVNADTIPTSDTFRYLALQIIDAFHFIIYNLSNPQSRDVVKEIGFTHSKYNGQIKETDINGFCAAAIKVVPLEGGARFDNLTWLLYSLIIVFFQGYPISVGQRVQQSQRDGVVGFPQTHGRLFQRGTARGLQINGDGEGRGGDEAKTHAHHDVQAEPLANQRHQRRLVGDRD